MLRIFNYFKIRKYIEDFWAEPYEDYCIKTTWDGTKYTQTVGSAMQRKMEQDKIRKDRVNRLYNEPLEEPFYTENLKSLAQKDEILLAALPESLRDTYRGTIESWNELAKVMCARGIYKGFEFATELYRPTKEQQTSRPE